ncbi:hypothetical protein CC79DRAFT_1328392 [Sarocladium strictum]
MTGKPSHPGEVLIVGSSSFWRLVKLIRDMFKLACLMFRWFLFFLGNHEQEFDIPRAQLTLTAVPMPLRSPWMDSIAQTRPTSSKRANFSDQVGGVTILVPRCPKGTVLPSRRTFLPTPSLEHGHSGIVCVILSLLPLHLTWRGTIVSRGRASSFVPLS